MSKSFKMSDNGLSTVFLVALVLWSSPPASAQKINGKITDGHTGLPIAGVQLTFIASPIYAATQDDGTYTVSLPEGSYTVQISKDGYINSSLSDVPAISKDAATNQDGVMSSSQTYPWPFIVPPTNFHTLRDKVQHFKPAPPSYGRYWPDGKMLAFRSDPKNKTSPFIISINPDYRMTASNSFFDNVTGPAGGLVKDYRNVMTKQHGNYVTLPNNIPIPPPSVTGLRGDGMRYDYNDIWLFNAFRLSETSNSSADPNQMIGFVHNEDYWGYGGAVNGCTYKSIGVRYSNDLGKSWTRSVPIVTRLIQPQTHAGCATHTWHMGPSAGTGDMAAMWNPIKRQWVIYGQEGQFGGQYAPSPALVMSVSSDPLARPGTWSRIDPTTNRTDPGFIGSLNRTLAHGDLKSIPGANPTIIRDSKHNVWHIIYSRWGGGLVYANSTDLMRWTKPIYLPVVSLQNRGTGYPTLIGDEGDTLTTTGRAWLWVKGNSGESGSGYNTMYGALLDFGSGYQPTDQEQKQTET